VPELRRNFPVAAIPWGQGLFPVLAGMFLVIRLLEEQGTAPIWLRSFGDDFLCLPLVLGLVVLAHRLVRRESCFVLPVSHGLAAVVLYFVFFEGILPRVHAIAVSDPWDGVLYLCGFLVFQLALNRPGQDVAARDDRTELWRDENCHSALNQ
jgi:hypothetical protein